MKKCKEPELIHFFEKINKNDPKKQWNSFLEKVLLPNPGYLTIKMSSNNVINKALRKKIILKLGNIDGRVTMFCLATENSVYNSEFTREYGKFGFSVSLKIINKYGAIPVTYYIPSLKIFPQEANYINDLIDESVKMKGDPNCTERFNGLVNILNHILIIGQPLFGKNKYPYFHETEWRICDNFMKESKRKRMLKTENNYRRYYLENNNKYLLIKIKDIKVILFKDKQIKEYAINQCKKYEEINEYQKMIMSKMRVFDECL